MSAEVVIVTVKSVVDPWLFDNSGHPLFVFTLVFLIKLCCQRISRRVWVRFIQKRLKHKISNVFFHILYFSQRKKDQKKSQSTIFEKCQQNIAWWLNFCALIWYLFENSIWEIILGFDKTDRKEMIFCISDILLQRFSFFHIYIYIITIPHKE